MNHWRCVEISFNPDWQIDNCFFNKPILAHNQILVQSEGVQNKYFGTDLHTDLHAGLHAGYHVSGSQMSTTEVKKEKGQLHGAVKELVNDTLTSF